jgi:hypothetical protein
MDVSEIQQSSPKLASHRWLLRPPFIRRLGWLPTPDAAVRGVWFSEIWQTVGEVLVMTILPQCLYSLYSAGNYNLIAAWRRQHRVFFPKYRDPISGSVFSGVDSHDPKICKTNDDLNLRSVTDVLNLFTRDLKIRMCCLWKYWWDLRILNKSGVLPMY